jgi:hypothetical protein
MAEPRIGRTGERLAIDPAPRAFAFLKGPIVSPLCKETTQSRAVRSTSVPREAAALPLV